MEEARASLPKVGTIKLYHMLKVPIREHGIKMGRVKLYDLLADHGMLIKRKKRKPMTTDSDHPFFKYGNLVRDIIMTRINQIWVSDITYIRGAYGFAYFAL